MTEPDVAEIRSGKGWVRIVRPGAEPTLRRSEDLEPADLEDAFEIERFGESGIQRWLLDPVGGRWRFWDGSGMDDGERLRWEAVTVDDQRIVIEERLGTDDFGNVHVRAELWVEVRDGTDG